MKTALHLVAALALVVALGPSPAPLAPPGAPPATPAADDDDPGSLDGGLGPGPILFGEGYFTGTWCYISCTDTGPFTSVRSFSTQTCCSACADFCGTGCVSHGRGVSVLCDRGL